MNTDTSCRKKISVTAQVFLDILREKKGKWDYPTLEWTIKETVFFDQSWDGTRIFLKDLCFEGEVDFGFSKPTQLIIENCSFQGGLKLDNAEIEHLELPVGCDLKQGPIEL